MKNINHLKILLKFKVSHHQHRSKIKITIKINKIHLLLIITIRINNRALFVSSHFKDHKILIRAHNDYNSPIILVNRFNNRYLK